MSEASKFTIKVPSDDPKRKDQGDDKVEKKDGLNKGKGDANEAEGEEMSEEDIQLRNELEMLIERLKEPDTSLYRPALETLRTLIRTSTSSMTSVPKPLKFLRPHFPDLQNLFDAWPNSEDKTLFADILSVLAMTYSDTQPRGTLRYRLLAVNTKPYDTTLSDPGSWGHEYVRHLAAEIHEEFAYSEEQFEEWDRLGSKEPFSFNLDMDGLRMLAAQCAKFFLSHNAEPDAVDIMDEVGRIANIGELVDENTYRRVCTYMVRCVNYLIPADGDRFLRQAHDIYLNHSQFPEALALAIRLGDPLLVRKDYEAPANPIMKKQLAFLIARAQIPLDWLHTEESGDETQDTLSDEMMACLSNVMLSDHFREFGKELGVTEPKSLEDVYKSHLENTRSGNVGGVDSARANLAGTFVNAFVNAGFGNDKLMVEAEEGTSFVYKNKDHGMMSAAASLGLCLLWDTDFGLSHVDKYTYSSEEHIKAGALFATGLVNCGVRTDADPAIALLEEHLKNPSVPLRTGAIMGLGMAYAGMHREDVMQKLLPFIIQEGISMELASLAALALGFVYVGSGNGEIASAILETMMERESKDIEDKWARFMALGLALLYLGVQEDSDATIATLKAIDHPIAKTAQILVDVCSFAGTGNVLKVQAMLHHCDEHIDMPTDGKDKGKEKEKEDSPGKEDEEKENEPKKDDMFQSFAVLGIALLSMGEDIGAEMSLRQFNHLMHYGEPVIRRAVPLALGLVSASNPVLTILDTLSKYSHDNDLQVALNAIFAMGLVGAGSNNARLAQMLRQLAGYYHKEPDCLFMVRIAQGLVHMGKGTITINPFFSDRSIMSRPAVAGLLAVLTAFTDTKAFILDKYHWMLFFLAPAMYPRFMITLDEELKSFPVTVRVGQAVDVVGQAGKPRTISGFQTHQTPVRLGTTERAELATEEFIPYASVLEGFVILKKNPGWAKEEMAL